LNLASFEYGAALHSFGISINLYGSKFTPAYHQGVIGIPMDELLESIQKEVTQIKIDAYGS